jgi:hypothetical protein
VDIPKARACIFCGSSLRVSGSNEHIVPRWLLECLDLYDRPLHHVLYKDKGQSIAARRDHQFASLVSGRICSKCNSGWLAQLESRAKPLLLPLLDGTYRGTLPPQSSQLIATWMFKTALTLDSASQRETRLVPDFHYKYLHENQAVPLDVAIAAAPLVDDSLNWIEGGNRPVLPGKMEMDRFTEYLRGTYKISLGIGRLAWRVEYWPAWPVEYGPGFGFSDHYDGSVRYIWLRKPLEVSWPPPETIASVQQLDESNWLRGET